MSEWIKALLSISVLVSLLCLFIHYIKKSTKVEIERDTEKKKNELIKDALHKIEKRSASFNARRKSISKWMRKNVQDS